MKNAPEIGNELGREARRVAKGSPSTARRHPDRRPDRPPVPPSYAAIDLGTNNCRLLVARPAPGGFRVIDGFSRIVRLGEGLSASGKLSDAAIERTTEALRAWSPPGRGELRGPPPPRPGRQPLGPSGQVPAGACGERASHYLCRWRNSPARLWALSNL